MPLDVAQSLARASFKVRFALAITISELSQAGNFTSKLTTRGSLFPR